MNFGYKSKYDIAGVEEAFHFIVPCCVVWIGTIGTK